MNVQRHIFIGSAWPYANGPLHLGHIAALLPADVLARYFRLRGDHVFFDSGSDAHGTPITVRAEAEGKHPKDIANYYHRIIKSTFARLGFSFDHYTITTTTRHAELVQEIFLRLKERGLLVERTTPQAYCERDRRFLPDRYVEGTCPVCGFGEARGDQCERCGSLLEPERLTGPRCKLCGQAVVQRPTKHFFLQLRKLQPDIRAFVASGSAWRGNALAFTHGYLKDGLQERAITRDIDWGVPVPVRGYEGKRIYVWFEAVCGYYTAHRQWAEAQGKPDAWKPFWNPDASSEEVRHYYVHGKDNIPFHTIIWPAILLGLAPTYRLRLPDVIVSSEYLTIEGQKLSTSRNWAVWANDVLERYQPDALRYYLLANGPETRDADFSWETFVAKTNNELVATYGNFVQRIASFALAQFPRGITVRPTAPGDQQIIAACQTLYRSVGEQIEAAKLKSALSTIFEFLKTANVWLNTREPWKAIAKDRADAEAAIATGLILIHNLLNLTAPFLPFQAQQLAQVFAPPVWQPVNDPPAIVPALQPLFRKINPAQIEQERAKLDQA